MPVGDKTLTDIASRLSGEVATSSGKGSRWIENGSAVIGVLLGAAYVAGVEIYPHIVGKPACADHGIPWGVVIVVTACVVPKTIGRVTAGKVWDRFAPKPS